MRHPRRSGRKPAQRTPRKRSTIVLPERKGTKVRRYRFAINDAHYIVTWCDGKITRTALMDRQDAAPYAPLPGALVERAKQAIEGRKNR